MPVKTGQPPKNVADLFDAGTKAAMQGLDKDALFALSDNGGQFVLATAMFNYKAYAGAQGGTLSTACTMALTFTHENGQWKITGYDVSVTRQGAQVEGDSTTTAVTK